MGFVCSRQQEQTNPTSHSPCGPAAPRPDEGADHTGQVASLLVPAHADAPGRLVPERAMDDDRHARPGPGHSTCQAGPARTLQTLPVEGQLPLVHEMRQSVRVHSSHISSYSDRVPIPPRRRRASGHRPVTADGVSASGWSRQVTSGACPPPRRRPPGRPGARGPRTCGPGPRPWLPHRTACSLHRAEGDDKGFPWFRSRFP